MPCGSLARWEIRGGLALLEADASATGVLVDVSSSSAAAGRGPALAPHAHAMMDVSDGLLIDTMRLAEASGLSASIDLDAVPLSRAFVAGGARTRRRDCSPRRAVTITRCSPRLIRRPIP